MERPVYEDICPCCREAESDGKGMAVHHLNLSAGMR